MPTGYTAKLAENGQSFEDFVLGCARAFGACVHQRDDPSDEKPKLVKNTYYQTSIETAKRELEQFDAMTPKDRLAFGEEERQKEIESCKKGIAANIAKQQRYQDMIDKVTAWVPPTPDHIELRNFMLSQLIDSKKFDASDYYDRQLEKAVVTEPAQYVLDHRAQLVSRIEYYESQAKEETNRNDKRNDWIIELYKSLNLDFPE